MSIASEISRLQQAKSDLATSIENKGVTVPAATTIDGYAALVDQIQQSGSGIVLIEYLESTGTQYINTGYIPNIETSYMIDFNILETAEQASCICGCRDSATSNNISTFFDAGNVSCDFGNYSNTRLSVSVNTGRYVCENRKNYRKINNTSNSNVFSGTINATKSFYIFRNNGTTFANKRMRVYDFYLTDGNVTINLIPVRKGRVGYLYDRISGTLFGNAGTGSFTLGPDVT